MTLDWLPTEMTSKLHDLVRARAEKIGAADDPHAYKSGFYRAVINGLPDTPENREHIENTIKRLKERQ